MIRLLILLSFTARMLSAQPAGEVVQFNPDLNEFLNVRDFCLSENGGEAYFTIQSPNQEISQLAYIFKKRNKWSKAELLPFCDSFSYLEPFLSPDGRRLFFVSDRPLDDSAKDKKDFDIWYVERENRDAPWSAPKNIGKPVNSDRDEFYPSVSANNNLYFTLEGPEGIGKDDIYFSRWHDGRYQTPILLNENVNSDGYEFNAFISRNEDFLIYSKYNEQGGLGSGDLYISKKDANGDWQVAKNLGAPVNTRFMEYCPFYDEKNQILYFTSKRSNLTPRRFRTISDFREYIMAGDNGLSKIYMTPFPINSK